MGMFPILLVKVAFHYIIAKLSSVWEQVSRWSNCLTCVLINSSEIFLSFLRARKCHSQAEDAVAWSLCHSLEFSSLPKIRQIIYQQAWFSDDLYSQQPGCTLRNNSFHPTLESLYSYWKNEHLPGKFSSVFPFIPTTWWYLQTYHFYPAAQKLNIQEQGKASAGSSSFTSVSIISSAFFEAIKTLIFHLNVVLLWQGKCNLLRKCRRKSKVDLLLEPPAQIAHPHLHFDQRSKE